MKKQKSFTLIEMLIVIVIIGILAAALIPRLQAVQGRARDSKRKVDVRSIYNANEIYFTDNSKYPLAWCTPGASCAVDSYSSTGYRIPELSGVLVSIPRDPINNGSSSYNTGTYSYMYWWIFNTPIHTYDIITQLENKSDPDRCGLKWYKFFNDTTSICVSFGGVYTDYAYDVSPNVKNVP